MKRYPAITLFSYERGILRGANGESRERGAAGAAKGTAARGEDVSD
jgi:hypothetical protein